MLIAESVGLFIVATLQPDAHFGRILAAYGGVFVAGSLAWGMVADGYRPDRYDITGALVCLLGVAVIMYALEADTRTSASVHAGAPRATDVPLAAVISGHPEESGSSATTSQPSRRW